VEVLLGEEDDEDIVGVVAAGFELEGSWVTEGCRLGGCEQVTLQEC
jgi:hypothetical protein